jgi:hypothetical protein
LLFLHSLIFSRKIFEFGDLHPQFFCFDPALHVSSPDRNMIGQNFFAQDQQSQVCSNEAMAKSKGISFFFV